MPRFLLFGHSGDGTEVDMTVDEARSQIEPGAVNRRDRRCRAGCWADRSAGRDRGNAAVVNIDFGIVQRACPLRRNDGDVFDPNIPNCRGG
jgi:hypothetical protein